MCGRSRRCSGMSPPGSTGRSTTRTVVRWRRRRELVALYLQGTQPAAPRALRLLPPREAAAVSLEYRIRWSASSNVTFSGATDWEPWEDDGDPEEVMGEPKIQGSQI